tara:strand:+ start:555 stop:1865 length:1311 start_codon:yes stop_codon:yes gene_type:complete
MSLHHHEHGNSDDDHHDEGHDLNQNGIRGSGNFIITGLTSGHGVFHWFVQSFFILLPEVQETFNLNKVQVGSITTVREMVSGIVTLPGGIIVDQLKRHWGLILALCMASFGVGWFIVAQAPDNMFFLVLVGTGIIAAAASIWHLPAMASLSHHFSHRRGTALSFHGVGGSIGDAVSPIATGFLLTYLTWQNILSVYAAVPIFLAFLVYWAFQNIGKNDDTQGAENGKSDEGRFSQTMKILKNPLVLWITLVGGIRGMAFIALLTFLPFFFDDVLGMSDLERGLHFGLLVAVGIVSTPIMGYLSDRVGRKLVIVPGMLFLGVVVFLISLFDSNSTRDSIAIILLLALLGTFFYSDQPILTASALDIVGSGVATTTLGTLSFARFVLSAASPIIAGALYENYSMDYVFYYVSGLMILGAIILFAIPLKPPLRPASHHH